MNRIVAWIVTAALLGAHASGIAGAGALGAGVFEGGLWVICSVLFYLGYRDHPRSLAPLVALGAAAGVLTFETRRLGPDETSALAFAVGPLAIAQVALAMGRLRGCGPSDREEIPGGASSEEQAIALVETHARSLRSEGRDAEADELEARIEKMRRRGAAPRSEERSHRGG